MSGVVAPIDEELESFRLKWRQEISNRRDQPESSTIHHEPRNLPTRKDAVPNTETSNEQDSSTYTVQDTEPIDDPTRQIGTLEEEEPAKSAAVKSLELFEAAIAKEDQGALGESLTLYRQAYKLDDAVDVLYRKKHFPVAPTKKTKSKPAEPPSNNSKPAEPTSTQTTSDLILSFHNTSICPAEPEIEGDVVKPCRLGELPEELLMNILTHVANRDIANFVRLSQVCKRLAYLTMSEDSIWRGVVSRPEFGFGAMHYDYIVTLKGRPIIKRSLNDTQPPSLSLSSLTLTPPIRKLLPPLSSTHPRYIAVFKHRPRLRFSGLYISTVNYIRQGAVGPESISWTNPVHVVTYYRYLRFYRDGTCISLLTTTPPAEIVPVFKRENLPSDKDKRNAVREPNHAAIAARHILSSASAQAQAQAQAQQPLASTLMRDARRGRWKLSVPADAAQWICAPASPSPFPESDSSQPVHSLSPSTSTGTDGDETTLSIETEGASPQYIYHMALAITSTSISSTTKESGALGPRNTKLAWRRFSSFNTISADVAEFALRNDRAFVWSRVKGWGAYGE